MTGRKTTKITRKIKFTQIMKNKKAVEVLMDYGIYCMGCPRASTETLEQGLEFHGLDVDKIVAEINAKINEKRKNDKIQQNSA